VSIRPRCRPPKSPSTCRLSQAARRSTSVARADRLGRRGGPASSTRRRNRPCLLISVTLQVIPRSFKIKVKFLNVTLSLIVMSRSLDVKVKSLKVIASPTVMSRSFKVLVLLSHVVLDCHVKVTQGQVELFSVVDKTVSDHPKHRAPPTSGFDPASSGFRRDPGTVAGLDGTRDEVQPNGRCVTTQLTTPNGHCATGNTLPGEMSRDTSEAEGETPGCFACIALCHSKHSCKPGESIYPLHTGRRS